MKKKWTVFSLVILLIQYFSPLVALADTINSVASNSLTVTEVVVSNMEDLDPNDVSLTVKGNTEATSNYQAELALTGIGSINQPQGAIVNSAQQSIGSYQVIGQTVKLSINEGTSGPYELKLNGQLLDKVTPQQAISASVNQQSISTNVTLKPAVANTPAESSQAQETNVPPSSTEPAQSTEVIETSESTKEDSIVAAKATADRENIDISDLLGDTKFFTGIEVLGPDGKPLSGQTVELGDKITVNFDFEIPDDVREQMQAGDFYDAQLPAEIKIVSEIKFDLVGATGVYGQGVIGTDGKIHIVFNEKVEEESNISGTVTVTGDLQQGNLEGPGPGEIEFPFVEEGPSVPIIVKPNTDQSISKKGHPDRPTNPNEIIWDVDVNLNLDTHTNAKVTENFPDGTKFESVAVYKVKVDFNGKVIEGEFEEMTEGTDYTVDADGNVSFIGVIKDAYRLEYTTSIIQEEKPGAEGGTVEYKNEAFISSDELDEPIKGGASVTAKYNKALEKLAPEYDPSTQEFKWTIRYNYVEFDVPTEDAHVSDSFTSNMILKDNSVILNKVTFNDNGDPVVGAPLVEGTDYKLIPQGDGKGFKIEFIGKMDYAVDIHYVTQVDEEVTENQIYNNQVIDGSGNQSHNQGEAHQQGLIKHMDGVDYNSKTIAWSINVNMNGYELNNWSMTDQMSPGLILALGTRSFVIQDLNLGSNLEQGVDYEIVYDEAAGKIDVKFIGGYAKTNHKFLIRYNTKFDTAVLNEAGYDKFFNDASSKWTSQDGEDLGSGSHVDYKPKPEEGADGFKNGNYNALTKTITWTLGINYNRQPLGDVKITDPITSNQKFVSGSLKAFRYTISADGSIVKGAEILPAEFGLTFGYTEPSEGNGNTLEINVKDVGATDQFLFEFETSLDGEIVNASKEYHNKATVDAENVEGNFSIEGDVSIANGGSLIQKSGKQDKDGYLQWTATINPSQSTVYDAKVTDTPSTNQVIDESSVIVYETNVTEAGKLSQGAPLDKSKYTVSLTTDEVTGQQELVVTFTDEKIEHAYILEYKAMLLLEKPSGETAKNNIKLEGTNKENVEQEVSKEVGVSASEGGGTAVGESGSVEIRKVDNDGKVLTGATFELWDKKNAQKLREGEVSADGTLLFGKLPYGEYFLKETKAPAGHSIQSDLIAGRKIKIDKNTSTAGNYLDIVNEINRVVLEKQAEDGTKLVGAKFKLEQKVDDKWVPVAGQQNLTTDADGQLVVKGLTAGSYRFTETAAPADYVLDTTPIEFEVVTSPEGQTPEVKVGPVINYLGSASFIKKDGDDTSKILAGAEFKIKRVKDGSGKEINQEIGMTYKSDANGKVTMTGLAPGEYEVTEIKAPAGYLINTDKISFTIANTGVGKPAEVTADDFLDYQGSVELTKTDVNEQALAGAEFQIKDAAGNDVGSVVTTGADGKVKVDGLAPGKYTLNETKAPTGFIKNTEPLPFEILAESAGKPTVVTPEAFINYKGAIRMIKVNTSGEGLPGAEFALFHKDDDPKTATPINTYESDERGRIEIKDLAPGQYKLVETKAPVLEGSNYVKNDYPRFFEIPEEYSGEVKQLNLGEYQNFKGKAVISKKSDEGASLGGAEFELYILEVDGTEKLLRSDIVSNPDGSLNIDNLGAGYYKLVETKAPAGHLINTNPIFITVQEGDDENPITDEFDFKNYEATIQFKKTDDQGALLKGATFNIYKADDEGGKVGDPVNATPLTSESGEFEYKGLEVGKYVLEEVTAADDFIKNTQLFPFEIEGQVGEPEVIVLDDFVNYQGSAELVKTDNNGKVLAGAEFTLFQGDQEIQKAVSDENGLVSFTDLAPGDYIAKETKAPAGYIINEKAVPLTIVAEGAGEEVTTPVDLGEVKNYQGSVSFLKTDKAGTALAGAVFGLFDETGENEILDPVTEKPVTVTATAEGKVKFENLAPGKYQIKEIKAVDGYILNDKPIEVTIAESADDQAINLTEADFVNYKGSVSVIKKDQNGNVLPGAEFTIYDENGEFVQTQVTGEDGVAIFDELAPNDNYLLKETKAPAGYILNSAEMPFDVKGIETDEPEIEFLGEYINFQGSAELVKKDKDGNPLEGAEFTLTLKDSVGEKTVVTSDEDGKVVFENLAPGEYTVTETKAAEGYILSEGSIIFTVDETFLPGAGEEAVPELIELGDFINYKGSAELIKTDEDGNGLAGAEFTLRDETGQETKVVSDENGNVLFDELAPGEYTVVETKAADGYLLNTTELTFTIGSSFKPGENVTPLPISLGDFINYQGDVTLTKVDKADAKKVLAGAEFKIVDKDNQVVREKLVTDNTGNLSATKLAPGTYYFVETKAPTGYQLSNAKTKFVIAEDAEGKPEKQLVTVTNEKTPNPIKPGGGKPTKPGTGGGKLPQMNEILNNAYLIAGLSMIVFGSSIYRARKKTR
ncbi:hypothetical protein I6N95_00265 [Vagococcus sp. BWB3-3]|uniref:LPXTG cell wall anchor domain-containing protein n=1 Tax=Vagococcus allomyrinae TaxID=2794353 RepID=A0A940P0W4_9ENTE|nr:SpaA isopeptide-forming pilin-related protein [Vagococcus allomyrinae]MBP1039427.1 hypothetical protein [Vagococcus allomyrinae]